MFHSSPAELRRHLWIWFFFLDAGPPAEGGVCPACCGLAVLKNAMTGLGPCCLLDYWCLFANDGHLVWHAALDCTGVCGALDTLVPCLALKSRSIHANSNTNTRKCTYCRYSWQYNNCLCRFFTSIQTFVTYYFCMICFFYCQWLCLHYSVLFCSGFCVALSGSPQSII